MRMSAHFFIKAECMEYDTPVQSCITPVKYTNYDEIKEACGSVLGSFSSHIAGKKMKFTLGYDQRQHTGESVSFASLFKAIITQSDHNFYRNLVNHTLRAQTRLTRCFLNKPNPLSFPGKLIISVHGKLQDIDTELTCSVSVWVSTLEK